MLKRIVLTAALASWLMAPAALAQDHGGASHTDATGQPNVVRAAGQGVEQHPTGAADAHDTHGAPGAGHERPPLLPDPTSRETQLQALWVVIIFVALLAILIPTAFRNVLAGLKKREQRIRQDIADAEASRAKAEATLRQYNQQLAAAEGQIRDMLSKAAADGERLATNLKMQAQQESEEIKQRATREIEAAKDQAVREVHEHAATLATSVAEKILRRNLNPDDQRDLVNRSLEQLQSVSKN